MAPGEAPRTATATAPTTNAADPVPDGRTDRRGGGTDSTGGTSGTSGTSGGDASGGDASGGSGGNRSQHDAGHNGTRPAAATALDAVRVVQPAAPARSRAKRLLDIGLTLAVLPFAGLMSLVIGVLVATTSRGPVFFVQERVGLGGRRFRLVKFRTMHVDAEERLRNDPELWHQYVNNHFKLPAEVEHRVTPFGRFLRSTSLDELPQLYNVLVGHMSLVGPRPVVPEELEMYGESADEYLAVKPGITGLWQVSGRSGVGYPERVDCDRAYAASWSVWLDLKILARTPLTVLRGHGAF